MATHSTASAAPVSPEPPAARGAPGAPRALGTPRPAAFVIRSLSHDDLQAVCRIDARLTGLRKTAYWRAVFDRFLQGGAPQLYIGLGAESRGRLAGYLFGEVRAVEFGSEPCGWIFAVGVNPSDAQRGLGSALVTEACVRFRAAGVISVRTMVRRNDVPMLAFFRSNGFVGGSYVQLETHVSQE